MTHLNRVFPALTVAAAFLATASLAEASPYRHVRQAPVIADNHYDDAYGYDLDRRWSGAERIDDAPIYNDPYVGSFVTDDRRQMRPVRNARLEKRSRKMTRKMFKFLDRNRDRYLSYNEVWRQPRLRNRFWRIDRNRDGYLSRGEVKRYHRLVLMRRHRRLAQY